MQYAYAFVCVHRRYTPHTSACMHLAFAAFDSDVWPVKTAAAQLLVSWCASVYYWICMMQRLCATACSVVARCRRKASTGNVSGVSALAVPDVVVCVRDALAALLTDDSTMHHRSAYPLLCVLAHVTVVHVHEQSTCC